MKKSASAARTIRIKPSAPMPKWRSHTAATNAAFSDNASSRSSIKTKSLPAPRAFTNSPFQLTYVVCPDFLARACDFVRREPAHARITPEPRHLPPRQTLVPSSGPLDELVPVDPTLDEIDT